MRLFGASVNELEKGSMDDVDGVEEGLWVGATHSSLPSDLWGVRQFSESLQFSGFFDLLGGNGLA